MSFDFNTQVPAISRDVIGLICSHLSFQDLNRLAKTCKAGKIWANCGFDFFARALLFSGKTMEERKCELAKLYHEVSPHFIRSLHSDIDKIRGRVFEDGKLTVEYGERSYTPFFLVNIVSQMHDKVLGCEDISREFEETVTNEQGWSRLSMISYYKPPHAVRSGILAAGATGINIRQTPSNHDSDVVSEKLLLTLKKASEIFFMTLCGNYEMPDLDVDDTLEDMEELQKYRNKSALVIREGCKDKISSVHCIIQYLLHACNLMEKVSFINYVNMTCVYGEKEDIQKFRAILHAQQFPNTPPTMELLRLARGI